MLYSYYFIEFKALFNEPNMTFSIWPSELEQAVAKNLRASIAP